MKEQYVQSKISGFSYLRPGKGADQAQVKG